MCIQVASTCECEVIDPASVESLQKGHDITLFPYTSLPKYTNRPKPSLQSVVTGQTLGTYSFVADAFEMQKLVETEFQEKNSSIFDGTSRFHPAYIIEHCNRAVLSSSISPFNFVILRCASTFAWSQFSAGVLLETLSLGYIIIVFSLLSNFNA